MSGAGRVWGTSPMSEPSVTIICARRSSATSATESAKPDHCVDVSGPRPAIVETTSKRLLYFGMALTAEESIETCRAQLDWSPRLARAPAPAGREPAPEPVAGPRP